MSELDGKTMKAWGLKIQILIVFAKSLFTEKWEWTGFWLYEVKLKKWINFCYGFCFSFFGVAEISATPAYTVSNIRGVEHREDQV
jgi:hypothetical protein